LKGGKVALEVLVRGKDAEQNEALFKQITDKITGAGVSHIGFIAAFRLMLLGLQKKVGILPKDTSNGPFIDEWKKIYATISNKVEEVDIAPALSAAALAVKDENELVCLQSLNSLEQANSSACYAKCLESLHRPHEPLFRRRDVEYSGRREEGQTQFLGSQSG
jgi:nucleosome binding factor SPN SPT16 subunit